MLKLTWIFGLAFVGTLLAQVPAQPVSNLPASLQNGRFDMGEMGQLPPGWTVPEFSRKVGYKAMVVEDAGLPERRCLRLVRGDSQPLAAREFGNVLQAIDATPYRGKRVRLKAQLRCGGPSEGLPAPVQMWLRVDRPGQKVGFFDNMDDRPVRSASWTPAEIVGDVAPDAEALVLGFMVPEGGREAWMAPMTFDVLGDTPPLPIEGARPLSGRGLDNLRAFAVAMNLIRFFHPSDEAAQADWNRLASMGVKAIEGASNPKELADRLQRFFAPYAPAAQFLTSGRKLQAPQAPQGAAFVARWAHVGFGQNDPISLYRSAREYLPVAESRAQGWRDPLDSGMVDLGGRVHAWIPAVCFADEGESTIPKGHSPVERSRPQGLPEPTTGMLATADDRATRLGDVMLAWGVFQHFYPYFDVVKVDWAGELSKGLQEAARNKDGSAFVLTLSRMTAALRDGHIRVTSLNSGGSSTPSIEVVLVDGQPVVRSAMGSASHVPVGSRILALDGLPSERRMTQLRAEISAASEGWMNHRMASEFLAGGRGTKVKLAFLTAEGFPGEATIVRDANPWEVRGNSSRGKVRELKPGIWYVDLDQVEEQDFDAALPELAQAKGVVFDLRGYPKMEPRFLQHLTGKPLESARWNLPRVIQPDGKGWTWDTRGRWTLEPLEPRIQGKVAFLIGGRAISYAESCLGIVEAYKLAELVGEPTAGTNGNINPFRLPGEITITWTGMKVLKHDGSIHHGVGIHPTVPMKPTVKGIAAGRDEVLERGIEVVSN